MFNFFVRKLAPNMSIVLLEGNIGAGKSTFLRKLLDHQYVFKDTNVQPILEPVKKWTKGPMGNLLTGVHNRKVSPAIFQVNFLFCANIKQMFFFQSSGLCDVNFC